MSQSEAQNREGIHSWSPPERGSTPKSHVISMSQSEAQNGSAPDPLSEGDQEWILCDNKADR